MKNTTTILKILKEILLKNFLNIVFFLLAFFFVVVLRKDRVDGVEMVFLDVGQGDAILVQQDNFQILIDGGPDDTLLYELAKYLPWYDKRIEVVVLTHPHDDHLAGLMLLLKKYEVGKVLYAPVNFNNAGYEYLQSEYPDLLEEVVAGENFRYKDIYFAVLYPFEGESLQGGNLNNWSVITFFYINGYKILLMGDGEVELEEELLEYDFLRNIDILKAGHHCSKTSSSEKFLSFTQPEVVICMCGEGNKFGHPHNETLQKFKSRNVQYFVTYEEGSMRFRF